MIAYYVEKKQFYRDAYNVDRQLADGGAIPALFKNKTDAMDYMIKVNRDELIELGWREVKRREIASPLANEPLLTITYHNEEYGDRKVISLYKITIL